MRIRNTADNATVLHPTTRSPQVSCFLILSAHNGVVLVLAVYLATLQSEVDTLSAMAITLRNVIALLSQVGTQSDIRDQRYRTEPDIGMSDIGLKCAESDIISDIGINLCPISDINFFKSSQHSGKTPDSCRKGYEFETNGRKLSTIQMGHLGFIYQFQISENIRY